MKDADDEATFLSAVEKAGMKISNVNMADIDATIDSLTNLKTRVVPSTEGAGSEEDNMEFNQEQLEKTLASAVEKAVNPIKEELASVKKHLNLDEEKTEEDIRVEKAVEVATAPLREEIETLKNLKALAINKILMLLKKLKSKNLYGMAYCKPEGGKRYMTLNNKTIIEKADVTLATLASGGLMNPEQADTFLRMVQNSLLF